MSGTKPYSPACESCIPTCIAPRLLPIPWGSRTAVPASLGSNGWKGNPGPDFTVSVNGGDEWFAAHRPTYYMLTFHGHLAPEWLDNYFASRLGYGGGVLCQLTVPGHGTVLASTLNWQLRRRDAARELAELPHQLHRRHHVHRQNRWSLPTAST